MSGMATTCPNCRLQLAVTPSDLRLGQGNVRCGRCHRVFNALVTLTGTDDDEPEGIATGTGAAAAIALEQVQAATPPANQPPGTASDIPATGAGDTATGAVGAIHAVPPELTAVPAMEPLPAVPDMPDDVDVVETVGTGTFETIVLEGHGFLQTEEHVDASMFDAELQQLAERIEIGRGLAFPDEYADDDIAEEIVLELTEPLEPEAPDQPDAPQPDKPRPAVPPDTLFGGPAPVTRSHWAWRTAAAALALALLAQLVHHNRRDLVTTAWAAPVLGPVYAAFGIHLEPEWNLADYALRQLGGEAPAFARDRIIVRASVQNRARSPQPPPVLRVTLQDRFGNALATHDVPPQDYLRAAAPARLAPDQRLDAELLLEDPGSKAAGFELDACLPGADGQLHCAGAQ